MILQTFLESQFSRLGIALEADDGSIIRRAHVQVTAIRRQAATIHHPHANDVFLAILNRLDSCQSIRSA
jgi:hypothetical protein